MKILGWLGLLIASGAALTFFLPEESKERAFAQVRRLRSNPAQACFDYERTSLKDPFSARYDGNSRISDDGQNITIKYHARNGYGAYSSTEVLCAIKDGTFDVAETLYVRVMRDMDAKIACLQAGNKLMEAGKWSEAKALKCRTD